MLNIKTCPGKISAYSKQHLSNTWGSVPEKFKQHWGWAGESVAYKKYLIKAFDQNQLLRSCFFKIKKRECNVCNIYVTKMELITPLKFILDISHQNNFESGWFEMRWPGLFPLTHYTEESANSLLGICRKCS